MIALAVLPMIGGSASRRAMPIARRIVYSSASSGSGDKVALASSSSALVRVDEYADEFHLNDIGLAMFLSAYRPTG